MALKFISKLGTTIVAAAMAVNSFAVTPSVVNAAEPVSYEFEDGTLNGATAMTASREGDEVAHSGDGFVFIEDGGEEATVNVTVGSTGMYNLTLSAYAPYGSKIHNLLINGVSQGQISCAENAAFTDIELGMYKLNEGENTITVQSSWGWTYLDCITVSDGEFPELNVTNTLSDANASAETQGLMNYLTDVYGEHIISGQQEIYMYGPHDFEYEFEYINDLTGEYPALRGFDFLNQANILYGSDDGTTDRMIDWATNKNGIVTASWHVTVPKDFDNYELGVTKVDWSNATYAVTENGQPATTFDTSQVLVEGSKENLYYMACLEKLAGCIQELEDANVPLIFRPLHEAEGSGGESGSWFWWGQDGSEVYKELWKLTYDTLTNDYDLHNIIWEWNSYTYETSTNWYPGDEYVDMVGYDKYNCTDWSTGSPVLNHNDSAISGTFYNLVNQYNGKKLVAMAENDSVPTLNNLVSEKAGWLYFCPWYDGGSDSTNFLSNPVFNVASDLTELYQSDYCITLDELPANLYSYTSPDVTGTATTSSSETTTPSTTTTTAEPVTDIDYGNANCDNDVNIADVVAVRRYLVNPTKYPLSEQGLINADVQGNSDGVNAQDAVAIQKNVLGMVSLPIA